MNISPISFKGVSIGNNISLKIKQKKDKKYQEGFYQLANFLDEQRAYDFEIKKSRPIYASISSKIAPTQEEVSWISFPIRDFKNPKKIIKALGLSVNHGSKIGQEKWLRNFERYTECSSSDANDTNFTKCDIEAIITTPEIFDTPDYVNLANGNTKAIAINSENLKKAGLILSENVKFIDDKK